MTDCHVMLHPDWFYRQMRSLNFPTTKLIRTKFYSALKKTKSCVDFSSVFKLLGRFYIYQGAVLFVRFLF